MVRALVVVMILVGGCKKSNPTCDKFVDWSLKCPMEDELSSEERSELKAMLVETCEAAMADATGGVPADQRDMVRKMNASIRRTAECKARATSCDEAKACETEK